eukprot:m.199127 g.199127  ORF g.199127 m.199127 type:complete len:63 (+) comp18775_c0_seq4:1641-1829(+)
MWCPRTPRTHPATQRCLTKEQCCGMCKAVSACKAADLNNGHCHLKAEFTPKYHRGSTACVPN